MQIKEKTTANIKHGALYVLSDQQSQFLFSFPWHPIFQLEKVHA